MWFAGQFFVFEFPDAGKGGVVQLQLAVGAEHRHAFAQRVQRRGLHLHQRVVVALQRQAGGDVFIQEGQAAEGMRLGDDADRLATGHVPGFFAGMFARAVLIQRQAAALPGLIVALFGQFAAVAQPVEDFAVAGVLVEEAFGQAPQPHEGLVVE